MTGERARDGDYALNDLAALRARPFHAARDFEGFTHRDIVAPTVLVRHIGKRGGCLDDDRNRVVEDRRSHGSRLHADPAHHASRTPSATFSSRRRFGSRPRRMHRSRSPTM